jgi:repressor LexA
MLTRKQKELLLLVKERLAAEGVPPSFDEMKDALGLRSKSGIHRLITGLEERGFIKRLPHRARALEILRLPEGPDDHASKQANRKPRAPALPSLPPPAFAGARIAAAQTIAVPLYGRIAAGTPIEALRADPSAHLDVPVGMLATSRGKFNAAEHYALEVEGDSMIEDGIMDGDHVVIRKCDVADNGAIVVALVDDSEATLKHIEKRGSQIALIPANRNYDTRVLPADRVKVQGKLVGLVRKY